MPPISNGTSITCGERDGLLNVPGIVMQIVGGSLLIVVIAIPALLVRLGLIMKALP